MTYPEFINHVAVPLLCLFMAAVVLRHFRRYLQPRRQGENLRQLLGRAREDQRLDEVAARNMLGSATAACNIISMLLLVGFAWVQTVEYVRYVALFYLVAGLVFSRETARAARRPDFDRLGWMNKVQYRLFFAWFWPLHLHVWKREEPTRTE